MHLKTCRSFDPHTYEGNFSQTWTTLKTDIAHVSQMTAYNHMWRSHSTAIMCRCFEPRCKSKNHIKSDCINYLYKCDTWEFFILTKKIYKKMHSLFFFHCENSFAAPKDFYFVEYRLKWLFKCKRLPNADPCLNITVCCSSVYFQFECWIVYYVSRFLIIKYMPIVLRLNWWCPARTKLILVNKSSNI